MPLSSERYGQRVDVNADWVAVGVGDSSAGGTSYDRVYTYRRVTPTEILGPIILEPPASSPVAAAGFYGADVALGDNDWLAVSEVNNLNPSAVHLYRYFAGAWQLRQTIAPTFPFLAKFGGRVEFSGDFLAIMVPSVNEVRAYQRSGDEWFETPNNTMTVSNQPSDIAMSFDGTTRWLFVGVQFDNEVRVYTLDSSGPTFFVSVSPGGSEFGEFVDAESNRFVASRPAFVDSFLYELSGGLWSQAQLDFDPSNGEPAIHNNTLLVPNTNVPEVDVLSWDGALYVLNLTYVGPASSLFGQATALSASNGLVIGAPEHSFAVADGGSAWVPYSSVCDLSLCPPATEPCTAIALDPLTGECTIVNLTNSDPDNTCTLDDQFTCVQNGRCEAGACAYDFVDATCDDMRSCTTEVCDPLNATGVAPEAVLRVASGCYYEGDDTFCDAMAAPCFTATCAADTVQGGGIAPTGCEYSPIVGCCTVDANCSAFACAPCEEPFCDLMGNEEPDDNMCGCRPLDAGELARTDSDGFACTLDVCNGFGNFTTVVSDEFCQNGTTVCFECDPLDANTDPTTGCVDRADDQVDCTVDTCIGTQTFCLDSGAPCINDTQCPDITETQTCSTVGSCANVTLLRLEGICSVDEDCQSQGECIGVCDVLVGGQSVSCTQDTDCMSDAYDFCNVGNLACGIPGGEPGIGCATFGSTEECTDLGGFCQRTCQTDSEIVCESDGDCPEIVLQDDMCVTESPVLIFTNVPNDTACPQPDPNSIDAPCLAALCDPVLGCLIVPTNEGGACDDGLACTANDTCQSGVCVPGPSPCDDGAVCTDDSCEEITKCFGDNSITCSDNNDCLISAGTATCQGTCQFTGTSCISNSECPANTCGGGVCSNLPLQSCTDDLDCPQPDGTCMNKHCSVSGAFCLSDAQCTSITCGNGFCLASDIQQSCMPGQSCTIFQNQGPCNVTGEAVECTNTPNVPTNCPALAPNQTGCGEYVCDPGGAGDCAFVPEPASTPCNTLECSTGQVCDGSGICLEGTDDQSLCSTTETCQLPSSWTGSGFTRPWENCNNVDQGTTTLRRVGQSGVGFGGWTATTTFSPQTNIIGTIVFRYYVRDITSTNCDIQCRIRPQLGSTILATLFTGQAGLPSGFNDHRTITVSANVMGTYDRFSVSCFNRVKSGGGSAGVSYANYIKWTSGEICNNGVCEL